MFFDRTCLTRETYVRIGSYKRYENWTSGARWIGREDVSSGPNERDGYNMTQHVFVRTRIIKPTVTRSHIARSNDDSSRTGSSRSDSNLCSHKVITNTHKINEISKAYTLNVCNICMAGDAYAGYTESSPPAPVLWSPKFFGSTTNTCIIIRFTFEWETSWMFFYEPLTYVINVRSI